MSDAFTRAGFFVVDGITYRRPEPTWERRPMFEIIEDHEESAEYYWESLTCAYHYHAGAETLVPV